MRPPKQPFGGYGLDAIGLFMSLVMSLLVAAAAQGQAQPKSPPVAAPTAAPQIAAAPTATPGPSASGAEWGSFPTMLLEKVYRGPLRDTIIQRWRDPIDGSVCFVYLPISAPLLPQPADGYVQYGPSQIGSISCIHPTQVLQLWQGEGAPPVPAPAQTALSVPRNNGVAA